MVYAHQKCDNCGGPAQMAAAFELIQRSSSREEGRNPLLPLPSSSIALRACRSGLKNLGYPSVFRKKLNRKTTEFVVFPNVFNFSSPTPFENRAIGACAGAQWGRAVGVVRCWMWQCLCSGELYCSRCSLPWTN